MMNNVIPAFNRFYTAAANQKQPTILVVDADNDAIELLSKSLSDGGYKAIHVDSKDGAFRALTASSTDISTVLLDWDTLGGEGLEIVSRMQQTENWALIPVIVINVPADSNLTAALDVGAFYCLTKPLEPRLINSVIASAIREFTNQKTMQENNASQLRGKTLIDTARFFCKTVAEAQALGNLLASFYPEPEKAIIGITELLLNAVEHGNLGITYDEKKQLMSVGGWEDAVNARQKLPQYVNKKAEAVIQRKDDGIYLQVSDEGPGFEWWHYLEMDPARAPHPNGRGIALANKISFSRMQFTQNGSRVLAVVDSKPKANPAFNW